MVTCPPLNGSGGLSVGKKVTREMEMRYEKSYIIRFEGALTQGPNAGKSYTFAESWGGVDFRTEQEARNKMEAYRSMEPALTYKLLSRQYVSCPRKGFVETEIGL